MYFRSSIRIALTGATFLVAVVSFPSFSLMADVSSDPGGATVSVQEDNAIAAQKLLDEGLQLQKQGTADSLRRAMEIFERALPLWRASSDRVNEAKTLNYIGSIAHNLSQPQKALEFNNKALLIWQELGEQRWVAATLTALGWNYQSMGELEKALEYYERALPIRHALDDKVGEAQALNTIGTIHNQRGDPQRALEYYDRALPLGRDDKRMGAYTLNNIAYSHFERGEPYKALDYISQALPLWRAIGNRAGEAYALSTAGAVYVNLSNPEKALDNYGEALLIQKTIGFRLGEGQELNNIGRVHHIWSDYEKALEYYTQALKIFEDVGNILEQALTLNNIALIFDRLGESQKALDYLNRALALHRRAKDIPGEASTLNSIGKTYMSLNQPREARQIFRAALELRTASAFRGQDAVVLFNLASAHLKLGEKKEARECIARSLEQRGENIGLLDLGRVAMALLARADREDGNLVEARKRMEAVLDLIEAKRARIRRQDLRSSGFAANAEHYEFYIDLTMELDKLHPAAGYAAAAFGASERARARSLLDTLVEAHADIRRGIEPALANRERSLQHLINATAERITRLLAVKNTERQREQTRKELDAFLTEYQNVQASIRTTSPGYAAITQPQPLSLSDIQQKVVDKDTLLLEYSLGEERSYLWIVSPTSLMSFELPKRAVIEATARRLYELLAQGQRVELEVQLKLAAAELSDMVLGPVARQLGTKRLLIVADGALQYVPFASLPIPKESASRANRNQLLIAEHEIVSLPSASVLALLRQEMAGRPPAPKTVAVLADPVLKSDDPRVVQMLSKTQPPAVAKSSSDKPPSKEGQLRSTMESGVLTMDRLPYTRQEAGAIIALAQKDKRLEALDFDASRARAISPDLAEYRILHFATHGLLNSRNPELSGVVLSLVDEQGKPQDGFLRLHDIYNMKLGADLVVLSACRTALGKDVQGEGLIGLTRGFMYAGAPRVVASLWDVKDAATAELMKRFYRGMLKDGMRPAAALRAAQISMLQEKRWEAPYYWAGFVLQGEWK